MAVHNQPVVAPQVAMPCWEASLLLAVKLKGQQQFLRQPPVQEKMEKLVRDVNSIISLDLIVFVVGDEGLYLWLID